MTLKIGLTIPWFTWPGGASTVGPKLAEIARTAESSGFDSIWVMDHYFQIFGQAEMDMLEAYTTLGYLAGHTHQVTLGTMVTGVTYRHPGILLKQVTTLDVLSRGRAWLGIGAAWFDREHHGLGVPFPSTSERFERLEEALLIGRQMWNPDNNGAFTGKHYSLAETLCVPAPISRPRPRILIGGSGEKRTLRLVAKYADACNLNVMNLGLDGVKQKLEVLQEHCEREGRAYDEIEKTVMCTFNAGPSGETLDVLLEELVHLAELGIDTAIGAVPGAHEIAPIEAIGRHVIPAVAEL